MNITDHNTLTQLGHLQNIKESSKEKYFHKNPCLHFKDIPVGSTFFIIKYHIFVKAEHYVQSECRVDCIFLSIWLIGALYPQSNSKVPVTAGQNEANL